MLKRRRYMLTAAIILLLVLFGVARNLPWSPFTSWVPTYVLG